MKGVGLLFESEGFRKSAKIWHWLEKCDFIQYGGYKTTALDRLKNSSFQLI